MSQNGFKIALVGNPNSGKTTMFNAMTGSSAYVGNRPGVTVEKKEGSAIGFKGVTVVDLPGIYSLSPYSPEEVVTRDYLTKEKPDVIINIVDASNLERNLYLTSQLIETGVPLVVALNMMDVVKKSKADIDTDALSERLCCSVVKTSATQSSGIKTLLTIAVGIKKKGQAEIFTGDVLTALNKIECLIADHHHTRYLSVKLFERDLKVLGDMHICENTEKQIERIVLKCEKSLADDSRSIITTARYAFAHKTAKNCYIKGDGGVTATQKIDRIVTNKYLALPIFAVVMWIVYYISVSSLGAFATKSLKENFLEGYIGTNISLILQSAGVEFWFESLITDGILNGVFAVLSFVPQLAILFTFLALLEDSGYMTRVAFIMDRLLCSFGLSGKSFIPLIVASGCGVPGIMASRTIENERERRITIMVTTFIPCGAKLPVIALIAGSFFGGAYWVAPSIYFFGIAMVVISGIFLKGLKVFKQDNSPFIMELPSYHLPILKNIIKTVWERTRAFIAKAGTIILVASAVIWLLSNFDFTLHMAPPQDSMLAAVGGLLAPLFYPLGFASWQATVATITGLVAKESVVSTLAVLTQDVTTLFTPVSAYAFLVFNMLCAPCVAAVGAIYREMGSFKWTLFAIGYQTAVAYTAALVVSIIGSLVI